MAKKKVIIKKQPDDKKAKKKTIKKVKVKGKKSKKKAKATLEQAIIDKDELIDSEKTSEEIDALELDEVSKEISAFEEETSGEVKGLAGCHMFVEARILGKVPDMRANLDTILGNI